MGFATFYKILDGFVRFAGICRFCRVCCRVLPQNFDDFIGFAGFYQSLPVFAGVCRVLPDFTGFTGFAGGLPGFARFWTVLPGFTGICRFFASFRRVFFSAFYQILPILQVDSEAKVTP